jgi:hypothetical protein
VSTNKKNKSGRECFQKSFKYTEDVCSIHSWPDSVYTGKKDVDSSGCGGGGGDDDDDDDENNQHNNEYKL